jgi:putative oxidoreductase
LLIQLLYEQQLRRKLVFQVLRRFVQTDSDYVVFALRLVLAVVIFPQGAQKLLGWYGGFGFDGTMQFFASIGVPAVLALLVIASDFFGSIALALGLGGRLMALGTFAVMLGAMVLVHGEFGFFINWFGAQQGEGIQFHLLASAASLVVIVKGSGAWSFDRLIAAWLDSGRQVTASPVADRELQRAA